MALKNDKKCPTLNLIFNLFFFQPLSSTQMLMSAHQDIQQMIYIYFLCLLYHYY